MDLNKKTDNLIMIAQEQTLIRTMQEPQQMPIQPIIPQQQYQAQPQPQYTQIQPQTPSYVPPQQPIQPQMPVMQQQTVVPKQATGKQDFAARVREMNEAKKRNRLARQMAELQAEQAKMQQPK